MAKSVDKNLKKLPLGAVKAQGWLRDEMREVCDLQKRLGALPGLVKNGEWVGGDELPKYVRGIILLASCLDDKALSDKVASFVLPLINNVSEGGNFGPKDVFSQVPKIEAVKAILSYWEMSGDNSVILFLKKVFKNQFNTSSVWASWHNARARVLEEIPAIEAVYRQTDMEWLQDLGEKLRDFSLDWMKIAKKFPYRRPYNRYVSQSALRHTQRLVAAYSGADARRRKGISPDFFEGKWKKASHQAVVGTDGVNIAKAVKYPAMYGRFVGDDELCKLSLKMIASLEKYHGTPLGMFACDTRLAGKSAQRGVSVEASVEMIESLVEVIKETGDYHLVDLLEKIVYNVIGTSMLDGGVQDVVLINQVEASPNVKPTYADKHNAYITRSLSRGALSVLSAYPLYLQAACMTKDDQLHFLTYAPCTMDVTIGGCNLTISERTGYPFRNSVVFKVDKADGDVEVKLVFRVPQNTTMQLISGGQVVAVGNKEISVKCILRAGSTFMLKMDIPLYIEENSDRTVSMYKGNVLLTLRMPYRVEHCVENEKLLEVQSVRRWNATPVLSILHKKRARRLLESEKTIVNDMTTINNAPFELVIRSRNVVNWECIEDGFAPIPQRLMFSEEIIERTYIPFGCSKLHIAKYPKCQKK